MTSSATVGLNGRLIASLSTDPHKRQDPASTTKMWTFYTILTLMQQGKVSKDFLTRHAGRIRCMLERSDNWAAIDLAALAAAEAKHGAGAAEVKALETKLPNWSNKSWEDGYALEQANATHKKAAGSYLTEFVGYMNQLADQHLNNAPDTQKPANGGRSVQFVTADGMNDPGHYSTAYHMAYIGYVMQRDFPQYTQHLNKYRDMCGKGGTAVGNHGDTGAKSYIGISAQGFFGIAGADSAQECRAYADHMRPQVASHQTGGAAPAVAVDDKNPINTAPKPAPSVPTQQQPGGTPVTATPPATPPQAAAPATPSSGLSALLGATFGLQPGGARGQLLVDGTMPGAVASLQQKLIALGYNIGAYGPQKDGVDGKIGPKTMAALNDYVAKQQAAGVTAEQVLAGLVPSVPPANDNVSPAVVAPAETPSNAAAPIGYTLDIEALGRLLRSNGTITGHMLAPTATPAPGAAKPSTVPAAPTPIIAQAPHAPAHSAGGQLMRARPDLFVQYPEINAGKCKGPDFCSGTVITGKDLVANPQETARLSGMSVDAVMKQANNMAKALNTLNPSVREVYMLATHDLYSKGYVVTSNEGFRTEHRQNEYHARGRDDKGNIVDASKIITHARAGSSYHNYGMALDFVFVGKNKLNYNQSVTFFKPYGIEGIGAWDSGHFQIGRMHEFASYPMHTSGYRSIPDSGLPAEALAARTRWRSMHGSGYLALDASTSAARVAQMAAMQLPVAVVNAPATASATPASTSPTAGTHVSV